MKAVVCLSCLYLTERGDENLLVTVLKKFLSFLLRGRRMLHDTMIPREAGRFFLVIVVGLCISYFKSSPYS